MKPVKFMTLQSRYRRDNPWPKLYFCKPEDVDFLMRGLPCCLIVKPVDMSDAWYDAIEALYIEEGGERGFKRGECHDKFINYDDIQIKVVDAIERELGIDWQDATMLVPIFQKHLKWKATDTPEGIETAPDKTVPTWLVDKRAAHVGEHLQRIGPPMKLPNGDLIESCCSACPFNFQNMLGECSFGEPTCVERMDFPGKSKLLQNIKQWVKHREVMAHKDTQPDLPAFGHGDVK